MGAYLEDRRLGLLKQSLLTIDDLVGKHLTPKLMEI